MSSPIPTDFKVAYLCDQQSISTTGFWTYPENHQWNRDQLKVGLEGHNARVLMRANPHKSQLPASQMIQEIARLLQNWWYFGLLSEVLQTDIKHVDFTLEEREGGGSSVTTMHLGEYLHAWESRLGQQDPQKALFNLKQSKSCVDYVHRQVEQLGTFIEGQIRSKPSTSTTAPSALDTIIASRERSDDPVALAGQILSVLREEEQNFWVRWGRKIMPEDLELSICVLGHTLSHAIHKIQTRLGLDNNGTLRDDGTAWYTPSYVHRRLIRNGVCPRLISILQPMLSLVGMCLASFLPFNSRRENAIGHDSCSATRCNVDYLAKGVSPRRHAAHPCSCEDLPRDDFYDQVLCLLEHGHIPVVRVRKDAGSLGIEVLSSHETTYVAFSHVWSDGLGNQVANQLSQCQWSRLQSIIDDFFPREPPGSIPFWLDTICVPVVPNVPDGHCDAADSLRRRRMRNYAIERMRDTYHDAFSVIILDSTMLNLTAENLSPVELGLLFSFSRWMQRLWTMHEGAVTPYSRVFVRTANGTVQLTDVFESLQQIQKDETTDRNVSLLSSIGTVEAYQAWMLNLHIDVSDHSKENLQYFFRFAWNESRNRATKYEEDRYVVIASMLGIGRPQDFYDCKTEAERALLLFRRFDARSIPSALLFAAGDRLVTPGYRWAPSSIGHDRLEVIDQVPPAQRVEEGLIVEFEGWRLSQHPDWSRRHWVNRPQDKANRCPMDTKTVSSSGRRTWIVQTKPDNTLHLINLFSEDERWPAAFTWDNLAIIRQAWRRDGKRANRAILVAEKMTTQDGLIHVHYLAPLWWTWLSPEDERKILLTTQYGMMNICVASPVGDGELTPRWCID
ncbi:uncharacterized protein Z518_01778 [Rhinocladiella mackenziei CBS 650.93]|uniref:Rhinocladiella mackenziei CBS 650.93 unplaced genomic scaffold supercont1.1, whole genome shotgun sequence n=1 Tax=Rhinocladiella mackenziei CBS 650.93 TaxID=1442369 RepID=A0A0D2IXD7_9EURO|nr:uncharacterized protein Z518_01778 [Rhinocladiella mackenziei CBS 650.93]KIX10694.1 hypothetical protein Z518_01778 [Rhinocladiella mackenziei CBS 650.93]